MLSNIIDHFRKDPIIRLKDGNHLTVYTAFPTKSALLHDVELIGPPTPISHTALAKCPRNTKLPSLEQLNNPDYYQKHILPDIVQEMVAKRPYLARDHGVVLSRLEHETHQRNVFIFPSDQVDYRQTIQFVKKDRGISVADVKPVTIREGKILPEEPTLPFAGYAGVALFSMPVDFRDYFASPNDMHAFTGEHDSDVGKRVMDELTPRIVDKAVVFEARGVLMSKIHLESRLADAGISIGYDPNGAFLLGASYFV